MYISIPYIRKIRINIDHCQIGSSCRPGKEYMLQMEKTMALINQTRIFSEAVIIIL